MNYYITLFNYYNNRVTCYQRDSYEKALRCARFYIKRATWKDAWATIEDEDFKLHYFIEKTGVEIDYHKTSLERPF